MRVMVMRMKVIEGVGVYIESVTPQILKIKKFPFYFINRALNRA